MTKNVTFCFDFGSPYSYLAYNNLNSIREAGGEVTICLLYTSDAADE